MDWTLSLPPKQNEYLFILGEEARHRKQNQQIKASSAA
jgi:hypothetical protein